MTKLLKKSDHQIKQLLKVRSELRSKRSRLATKIRKINIQLPEEYR
jgi:hypothetical protein